MTNEEITIRQAREPDLERMTQIFIENNKRSLHREDWTQERASKKIRDYYEYTLSHIVEIKESVEGFISFEAFSDFDGDAGYILQLMVASDFQRKGIGQRLILSAEDYFRKMGIRRVYLDVDKYSQALNFYRRQGYGEAVLISMTKSLE